MRLPKWFRRKKVYPVDHDFWYSPLTSFMPTSTGIPVDEASSVKYLAVYACIGLISGDIARLPLFLYQTTASGNGKNRVLTHPTSDLTKTAPNPDMIALNWKEVIGTHIALWGNHYSQIIRDGSGNIVEIYPLPDPSQVEVYRADGGKLRYKWHNGRELYDMPRSDILHVAGWGFSGVKGLSPIGVARESVSLGMGGDQFAAGTFKNGAAPSVILTLPPEAQMDDEVAQKYLKAVQKQYSGVDNAKKIMLLRSGETVTPLAMPLKDAQFLESREFQKLEICGMYRMPPHKIGIHGANSNYSNLVQENLHYLNSCLLHYLTRIEETCNDQLLTLAERQQGLYFKFKVQSLLRGDHDSRSNFYQTMLDRGVYTRNEVRALEEMNPLPPAERGDETTLALNYGFAKDFGPIPDNGQGMPNSEPEPTEEEKQKRTLAWARKQRNLIEHRSVVARDRLVRKFAPLIRQQAQAVINRETIAIKKRAGKIDKWLDDFYQDFGEYVRDKMGPTLRGFQGAIADQAAMDTGADFDPVEINQFIDDYINTYVVRHIASSQGQMVSLAKEENADELIDQRADEWHEKRADKITQRETVQGSQGVYQAVAFAAGFATVFRTRGKSCPYCTSLDGTVVKRGEYIVQKGQELQPKGQDKPMTFSNSKAHPPIHQGCDCYLTIG